MRTLTERSAVIHMFLLNCGLFLFLWSSIQQSCDLLGFGFVLRVKFSPKQVFNRIKKLLIRGFTVAAVVNIFAVPQPVYTIKTFSAMQLLVTFHSLFISIRLLSLNSHSKCSFRTWRSNPALTRFHDRIRQKRLQ